MTKMFRWRWIAAAIFLTAGVLAVTVIEALLLKSDTAAIIGVLLGAIYGVPVAMCLMLARRERPGGPWDFR